MKHRDDRLTPQEVQMLNLHWKPLGRKICADCQELKDLNTDLWYVAGKSVKGVIYWPPRCKQCHRVVNAKRMRERYHNDAAYRAYVSATGFFYRQREGFKARSNAYQRRRYYSTTKPRRIARMFAGHGLTKVGKR